MTPGRPETGPVDPALVARFRRDVERLHDIAPGNRIALAVSGGPDSMALLTLAAAAYPGQVVVATVDHGLRAVAADEAAMVAAHALRIGVLHATLRITEPPATGDNLHAWARARRYALLVRWAIEAGASCLVTAHHADDQAETFLMRAARGSGVSGLAGIRARQEPTATSPIALIRPLIDWRVGDLRAVVVARGVPFVDDPSNVDPRYDRARMRALLRDTPWLDPMQIARSAEYAAEAEATLRAIEAWLWETRRIAATGVAQSPFPNLPFALSLSKGTPPQADGSPAGGGASTTPDQVRGRTGEGVSLDIADLPRELKRRLSRTAIHAVRAACGIAHPTFTDSTNIEPLLDSLESGGTATQAGVIVSVKGNVWRFAEQPPRRIS